MHLDDARRRQIAEELGLSGTPAESAIADLEWFLGHASKFIYNRETEPLPAHLLAVLEPVAKAAERLGEMILKINAITYTRVGAAEMWKELNEWTFILHQEIQRLHAANVEKRRCQSISASSGGARKWNVRETKEGIAKELEIFYRNVASNPTDSGKKRFLRIILKGPKGG